MDSLTDVIDSFDEIKLIESIALFGSFSSSFSDSFDDVDILIIARKRVVLNFLTYLSFKFKERGLDPIIFHTILKKPKKSNSVLFHVLNYPSISSLLKNEWKPVLNYFRSNLVPIYGSIDFSEVIPYYKLSKKKLFKNVLSWLNSIDSKEDFIAFKKYFIKLTPLWLSSYPYLDLSCLDLINSLFKKKTSWKLQLNETIRLLAV